MIAALTVITILGFVAALLFVSFLVFAYIVASSVDSEDKDLGD